ncbi:rRNA maturation RNase YbeY [Nesterenkonia sp. F]|uniref:rRNA maturation RNase YbeY n=1 Tax=Nesterenkonia sp. F TaxID=795955 RepID=UPI000496B1A1|nr:rRNA maturation RNase YbeY [Nesterenkonia sp. F]
MVVEDASGSGRVPDGAVELLRRLGGHVKHRLHLGEAVEVAITLIDDEQMAALHEDWLDLPGTTDVMSFPMDELRAGTAEEPVAAGMLGDVVISPDVAARQAAEAGHDTDDELALLAVHGMLHLLGHDHAEEAERRRMFALQTELLTGFLGRPAPTPTTGTDA